MLLLSVRDVHSHFELGNPPQKSHFFRGFLSPNCSRKNSVEYCDAGTFFFLFVAELFFQILLNNLFNLRSRISCLRTRVRDCFSHERKRGRGLLDGLSQLRLLVICWKRKVLEQGRDYDLNCKRGGDHQFRLGVEMNWVLGRMMATVHDGHIFTGLNGEWKFQCVWCRQPLG
ncbi:hypothetical protein CY35_04G103500 [Sphagnum magellanicum]|nr:hypothetical protein CY35_04G103500 [Sphagnum magellanicum]